MSSARDSYSMSPSAPFDIGTYSRSMHQHTKRQMEAASSSRRSSGSSTGSGGNQPNGGPSTMPNGVSSSSRSRNSNTDQFGYQS